MKIPIKTKTIPAAITVNEACRRSNKVGSDIFRALRNNKLDSGSVHNDRHRKGGRLIIVNEKWFDYLGRMPEIDYPAIREIDPVEDIVSNILSFHTLKQDWDGYGAIPSNVKTCANSISFITEVKEFKDNITEMYPNPHGTISIEWENLHQERLVVEIGEDGFSFYVKCGAEPLITGEFDTSDIAAEKISQHLKKLYA